MSLMIGFATLIVLIISLKK
ncbi:hypothetical protein LIQ62_11710 [Veillonella ratti]|nr:hypothetical protein [Veillonella ratti]MCB5758603.1 hypothetical protein [Veillonella ratti]MCB5760901.1 hypothetical protein [Veillonella ratti]MCB5763204.1 hypothetical protein [Veillonella ratti]MCB5783585.1 hypothetical protein [Veillonella ratti]